MLSFYKKNDNYICNQIELTNSSSKQLNLKCDNNFTKIKKAVECCVCLEEIIYNQISFDKITDDQMPYITRCCKQNLHIYCFIEWIVNCFDLYNYTRCPVCRQSISNEQINEELSTILLIQFKLFKPQYTFRIYKFIHFFFPEYEIPHVIVEIGGCNHNLIDSIQDNYRENTSGVNIMYDTNRLNFNEFFEKFIYLTKIFIVITFIIGFIVLYITQTFPH